MIVDSSTTDAMSARRFDPEQIAAMFMPSVAVRIGQVDPGANSPLPAEAQAMAGVRPSRRAEFFTGRSLARLAMTDAGLSPCELAVGEDRAPCWPSGLHGTIAHAGNWCLAAVSLTNSIGIDIEPCDQRLDDVHAVVLAPTEAMPTISHRSTGDAGAKVDVDPVLISFCAKEAVFKATWPRDHVWREFGDVAITVTGNTFAVTWAAEPLPGEVVGQWAIHADHVITTAWVI